MKNKITILTIFLLAIVSCITIKETTDGNSEYYTENKLSFFDPYESIYSDGRYQGYTYETWLRQPQNLIMVHETFKKIGYDKLVSEYDLTSNPCLLWGYVNRSLNEIIDSLVITYPLDSIESKYYREFWQRRQNEKNDQVVFEILQEISKNLLTHEPIDYDDKLVNDTLYNLVTISRLRVNPTFEQAYTDFEYLKSIGMHGSAYILLFENSNYRGIEWDKQKLVKELRIDTLNCCPRTWIIDDTK